jgi:hypothetical protein
MYEQIHAKCQPVYTGITIFYNKKYDQNQEMFNQSFLEKNLYEESKKKIKFQNPHCVILTSAQIFAETVTVEMISISF